jgi:hypothetical protein
LLSPPPLRTRRASFPAARSSLSNALVGTRLAAFTIRAWSRRTLCVEGCANGISVVICFSPLVGLPDSLVRKDQREVCPLSRGVMSPKAQLLSIPLQNGVRFLPRPLPAPLSTRLAVCLPIGRDTGSGSRAGLLPPSPLRTRRISFPIASSSLFCRPFYRTRL